MSEITWGMPVVLDLFFAGLAAGAFCFAVLIGRRRSGELPDLLPDVGFPGAACAVGFGLSMLILDLRYKTRFWFTMTVFNGDSPMSLGVWLLTLFSFIAAFYAIFWIPAVVRERIPVIGRWPLWSQQRVRDALGWVGVPIALMVSIYTGVLLSSAAMPLWRNIALPAPLLFFQPGHGICGRGLAGDPVFTGKASGDHCRPVPVAATELSNPPPGLSDGASRLYASVLRTL